MIQMFGDSMFNYPVDRMVKLHGNKVKLYISTVRHRKLWNSKTTCQHFNVYLMLL